MKIYQLIAQLQDYRPDLEVCVCDPKIKGHYTGPVFLSLHAPVLGDKFVALHTERRTAKRAKKLK